MDAARRERLKEVLLLLEDVPAEARAAWIERRLADEPELAREVRSLLAARAPGEDARLQPLIEPPADLRLARLLPRRIGPYVVDALLGQGGMSNVYRAHVDDPVRRTVAVKVLRPGVAAREMLARFDVERHVIARLEHRNIARLLDAGADDEGRPWLAMELVDGPTITEYARLHELGLEARLALVRQVCLAVQHAHDRGILHRDLKPSNVLVAEEDGAPVPKVIDFGVAKLLEPDPARGPRTSGGQILGTLGHMSPEQADPHHSDADVRTDVYAIGVLAYEILTGTLPFPAGRWRGLNSAEIHAVLSRERPEAPSRRIADMALAREDRAVWPRVPPELDCVVLKALEPDRALRYARVSALTDDLDRFLRGDVVSARPPTRAYVLRAFVRRNRVAVLAGAAVLATFLAGIVLTTIGFRRAVVERDRAQAERDRSDRAARDYEEFSLLVRRYALTPRLGPNATFAEVVARAADDFQAAPPQSVTVRARLAQALGEALFHTGDEARARLLLAAAVRDFEDPQFDQENAPYRGALFFTALTRLAALARAGESEEAAAALWERARRVGDATSGVDASLRLSAAASHADVLTGIGEFERAEAIAADALAEARALGVSSSFESLLLGALGGVRAKSGRSPEGVELTGAAWMRRSGGPTQSATLSVMLGVLHGASLLRAGRVLEAARHMEEVEELALARLGPENPDARIARALAARAAARANRDDAAVSRIDAVVDALDVDEARLTRRARQARVALVDALVAVGREAEAEDEFRRLVRRAEESYGAGARSTAMLRWELGSIWAHSGRTDLALDALRSARAALASGLPPGASALRLLDDEIEQVRSAAR